MYTLAGTFSLPGEMSSKTDGSTFVGLQAKKIYADFDSDVTSSLHISYFDLFYCRLPFLPEMELGSHDLEVFDRCSYQIQHLIDFSDFNLVLIQNLLLLTGLKRDMI